MAKTLISMIKGMEVIGAKFIRYQDSHLYFEVKKDSEIDDKEKLKEAKSELTKYFGYGLKIRRI